MAEHYSSPPSIAPRSGRLSEVRRTTRGGIRLYVVHNYIFTMNNKKEFKLQNLTPFSPSPTSTFGRQACLGRGEGERNSPLWANHIISHYRVTLSGYVCCLIILCYYSYNPSGLIANECLFFHFRSGYSTLLRGGLPADWRGGWGWSLIMNIICHMYVYCGIISSSP